MSTQALEEPVVVGSTTTDGQQKKRPPLLLVLAAFGAVYVIWGSTYLGIHVAIQSMPPFLMAGARFLTAGIVLYSVMRWRGAPRPEPIHWRSAAIVGALLLLVGNGGVSWAEQTVPSNITALVITGTPLWMILVDWMRPGGRRPRGLVFLGLLLGFAGVGLIVGGRNHLGQSVVDPLGGMVLLTASVCWAIGSVSSRHLPQSSSALLAVAMQMIAGGVLLLTAGAAFGEVSRLDLQQITSASWTAFAYLTVFGSLVGFTAYVWLLQVSTPARVSTYAYVNPLIAVILGRVLLEERLPGSIILAAALTIGAVVLITVWGQSSSAK
jgi:drug/metabolite transporter (DMT)-like permease